MTTRRFTRRTLLSSALAAPLVARAPWGKSFWEKKPYQEWTEEEATQMLTDSPWAKGVRVRFELSDPRAGRFQDPGVGLPPVPGGGVPGVGWPRGGDQRGGFPGGGGRSGPGPPTPAEVYLTVRWSSALPVRQALLIDRFGRGGVGKAEARRLLAREEEDYVIEVFGIPYMVVRDKAKQFEAEIRESAVVYRKRGGRIEPEAVTMPPYGEHLAATLRYPRRDPIGLEDEEAEFHAQAGPLTINRKFKLKSMVYRGRLEL